MTQRIAIRSSTNADVEIDDPKESWRNLLAFWILGFVNNIGYVIMIAGAQEISAGGVGLVYFVDIFPSLFMALTGPYWFHFFTYRTRTIVAAAWMLISFLLVALGTGSLVLQLVGVFFSGMQSGMMGASFLGMASFYRSPARCLTAWSSGTGLAGLGGYLWLRVFHYWGGISFKATIFIACVFPVIYVSAFEWILDQSRLPTARTSKNMPLQILEPTSALIASHNSSIALKNGDNYKQMEETERGSHLVDGSTVGFGAKLHFISSKLMVYMAPLIIVFFAEYTMQTGVWSSIGFPTSSKSARSSFYSSAGLCYQGGVFVSRSSGVLLQANRFVLYLMPSLQVVLLAFFIAVGMTHFWYDSWLLILCFVVGLLGGGVYVNAYTLISREIPASHMELALTATNVGDTIGIMLADIVGLVLQGCMYSHNGLTGATIDVTC